MKTRKNRIFDLHCDLLAYLKRPKASPLSEEIGCSLPFLEAGNVGLQVFALYTDGTAGSSIALQDQLAYYHRILGQFARKYGTFAPKSSEEIEATNYENTPQLAALLAVENAAGLCELDEPLEKAFKTIDQLKPNLMYISLTHHGENRFGGGNYTKVGLKKDGEALLEFMSGQRIALDFSHTSDALAEDCLNYIAQQKLDIPIIASHSNFREIWEHPRNLPLEFAQAIAEKEGLIGMNFLRAFMHDTRPEALFEHIEYGVAQGFASTLAFGADYFYTKSHPDKSRIPFYFPEYEDARSYLGILETLEARGLSPDTLEGIAHGNVSRFLAKTLFA